MMSSQVQHKFLFLTREGDEEGSRAFCAAHILSSKLPHLFTTPTIDVLNDARWASLQNQLFNQLHITNLPLSTIVFHNGEYIGDEKSFYAQVSLYAQYKRSLKSIIGKQLLKPYRGEMIDKNNSYIYMDFAVSKKPIGRIIIELQSNVLPNSCRYFIKMSKQNKHIDGNVESFVGSTVKRIVPGGWIEAGYISMENHLVNGEEVDQFSNCRRGIVALNGCIDDNGKRLIHATQFIISLKENQWMDNQFRVIGSVMKGYDVLTIIEEMSHYYGRPLKSIEVTECDVIYAPNNMLPRDEKKQTKIKEVEIFDQEIEAKVIEFLNRRDIMKQTLGGSKEKICLELDTTSEEEISKISSNGDEAEGYYMNENEQHVSNAKTFGIEHPNEAKGKIFVTKMSRKLDMILDQNNFKIPKDDLVKLEFVKIEEENKTETQIDSCEVDDSKLSSLEISVDLSSKHELSKDSSVRLITDEEKEEVVNEIEEEEEEKIEEEERSLISEEYNESKRESKSTISPSKISLISNKVIVGKTMENITPQLLLERAKAKAQQKAEKTAQYIIECVLENIFKEEPQIVDDIDVHDTVSAQFRVDYFQKGLYSLPEKYLRSFDEVQGELGEMDDFFEESDSQLSYEIIKTHADPLTESCVFTGEFMEE